jgi:NAD(P)H-flavin reductase
MAARASVEPLPPGPMLPASFRIRSRRQDTSDTWTLALESDAGASGLEFAPGQFTMIGVAGRGEVPISISGDPDDAAVLVHTVRAVGAATRALCAAQVGDALAVRGPFGGAWPLEPAAGGDVVIVAGGIGLAPLRPAVLHALARRERYGRVVVLYGGRAPDQLLYTDELREWVERGAEVSITVDSAAPGWTGRVGVVTQLIERAQLDAASTLAMLCGPEVMMRFAVAALRDGGIRADRIHLSMERNMQCGLGHCGHCQLGPTLVCRDGPVYRYDELAPWLEIREL